LILARSKKVVSPLQHFGYQKSGRVGVEETLQQENQNAKSKRICGKCHFGVSEFGTLGVPKTRLGILAFEVPKARKEKNREKHFGILGFGISGILWSRGSGISEMERPKSRRENQKLG
jgi:hypothetical protein